MKMMRYNLWGTIGLGFIAFLLLNVLLEIVTPRLKIDLTADRLFTASSGTKKIINDIKEPVTLTLYVSKELSKLVPQYAPFIARVEDTLEDYAARSNGKIRLILRNPEPFSDVEDEAIAAGLQSAAMQGSAEKFYFGLVGTNSVDGKEIIPFFSLDREQFLEYDLSKLLFSLASPQRKKVAILSGLPLSGDEMAALFGQTPQPWAFLQALQQFFATEMLPESVKEIPVDTDVLLVIHPDDFPPETLKAIDAFVVKGGKVLAFVDPLSEAARPKSTLNLPSETPKIAFSDILQAWGVTLAKEQFVADHRYARRVQVEVEGRQQEISYLAWLGLQEQALAKNDVMISSLKQLNVGSAGALQVIKNNKSVINITPLVTSSPESMLMPIDLLRPSPDALKILQEFKPQNINYTLAMRLEGKVMSAFSNQPLGKETRLIVVADTDMLRDALWTQNVMDNGVPALLPFADNGMFVVSAIEDLSGGGALAGLGSRGTTNRPFTTIQAMQRVAEEKFSRKELELQNELKNTQSKLEALLKTEQQQGAGIVTPEQQQVITDFQQKVSNLRKELRNVQRILRKDIERVETIVLVLNIAVLPVLLSIAGMYIVRRKWKVF